MPQIVGKKVGESVGSMANSTGPSVRLGKAPRGTRHGQRPWSLLELHGQRSVVLQIVRKIDGNEAGEEESSPARRMEAEMARNDGEACGEPRHPGSVVRGGLHLRPRARKANWERGLRLWLMPFQRERGTGEREVMGNGERDAGCGFLRVGEGGSGWGREMTSGHECHSKESEANKSFFCKNSHITK